ncbi:AraC family transcriptional activator of pobA [Dysgonomonas sp. PFB1-18]|uniref:AraC family transcriptional regulator n=1 Tax=unclassified Dysgonomonas TaxID=2630389 RepID=UPI002475BF73|nr:MULTISPECIES: helix-turn-helix transcriptional regulator [unclassified Dysgonomonas]MDH6310220.1 AraC family transcriptional activator of pobA [Dysgonomonas sp. PF1-14]MDH6340039.1 AraC family transcriptional activator of pobA [Dysgonomonas sp. PF1-16]MDH6381854.1 AraC family transcriptional activator of pobA [Dysgonomonas sp. PFB1-18]MDH6398904.1 AraC family transcriptional activator of pobA [Dysgonomonas sp. PF1-23]
MALARIQLDEISEHIDPYAIKNFIISDKSVALPPMTSNYPFVVDGVIFAICIKGRGKIKINFKEYEIKANTIITVLPSFVIEYLERTEDLMVEFLIFSIDFMTQMPPSTRDIDISRSLVQSPCIEISADEAERYVEFHSFIVKQYKRKDHPFRVQMAKGLLYSLLSEVGGFYYSRMQETGQEVKASSHQEEQVSAFFRLLLQHHKDEKSLQFYADKMFLTPKYLSTIVKDRTGRTAFTWINEALIASAKYLLKTTNNTILQISDELNFPNASFFGRFFKKHTGLTPVQYRERDI